MSQRRCVVTGVSSGIGEATANALRENGHWVIGMDIHEPATQVDEFFRIDLSSSASIDQAASNVTEPLNGLCNIAGLPPRNGLETKILQVNFLGTKHLTQMLSPLMSDGSSIVNLASRAGQGWPNSVDQIKKLSAVADETALTAFVTAEEIDSVRAYNLSKEALILWSIAQTERLIKRGIRINCISPGAIETPILQDFADAFGDKMKRNVQRAGRAGRASEVAPLVRFLLSSDSAWINGSDIAIDGGMGAFGIADNYDLSTLEQL